MRRSVVVTGAGAALLAVLLSTSALAAPKVDLRDPASWQEKPADPLSPDTPRCGIFDNSACPTTRWEDEKSDIQRESERRSERRWQVELERRR